MRLVLAFVIFAVNILLLGLFSKMVKNTNMLEKGYNSIFLMSKYLLGCSLDVAGEPIQLKEKVLVLSNHPTSLDFLYLVLWAKKYNRLDSLYFIAKEGIGNIPLVGSYIKKTQCLVSKDFEKDKVNIIDFCKRLSEKQNYILVIFPEGTTFYPDSQFKSKIFSYNNNKPVFDNVLYPRHRGLELILQNLTIDQCIDITLFYDDDKKAYKCADDINFIFDCYPRHGKIIEKDIKLDEISLENIETFLEKQWIRKEKFIRKILERENGQC
jgi:1-acyl-sn-glycerol-3-phosphate acyltransferase